VHNIDGKWNAVEDVRPLNKRRVSDERCASCFYLLHSILVTLPLATWEGFFFKVTKSSNLDFCTLCIDTGKCKTFPSPHHEGIRGALSGGEWLTSRPGRFTLGKERGYTLKRKLIGLQNQPECFGGEKFLFAHGGIRTPNSLS
jgi:hypothetical protein